MAAAVEGSGKGEVAASLDSLTTAFECPAGTNLVIVQYYDGAGSNNSTYPTGITYDGDGLDKYNEDTRGDDLSISVYFKINPTTESSLNVVTSRDGSSDDWGHHIIAVSGADVDGTPLAGWQFEDSLDPGDAEFTITTIADGLTLECFIQDDATAANPTQSQTEIQTCDVGIISEGGSAWKAAVDTSTDIGYDETDSGWGWAYAGYAVNPLVSAFVPTATTIF